MLRGVWGAEQTSKAGQMRERGGREGGVMGYAGGSREPVHLRVAARQTEPVLPHQDELRSWCLYAEASSDSRTEFFPSLHNGPLPSGYAVLVPADRSVQADLGAV